jgi:hypothetical protein
VRGVAAVRVARAVAGQPSLDQLPADIPATGYAGADPPAAGPLARQLADDGAALDQLSQEVPRLRPAGLVLRQAQVRHLRRGHALEPDVHTPDHDRVAVDHACPAGKGRVLARRSRLVRSNVASIIGERPFMASQEPRQSGRGNGKGIFTSSRQAGHATHSLT